VVKSLSVLVILLLLLGACSSAPPTPATIGQLCSGDQSGTVVVQGRLSLPQFLSCEENRCRLNFGDGTDAIPVVLRASREPRSNMLKLPPDQYTLDDLQVVLDDGSLAGRDTLVAVTGSVRRPSANDCYLSASSVALP
jgi:hypothetical protein